MDWEKRPHMPHLAMAGNYLLGAFDEPDNFRWWVVDIRDNETVANGNGSDLEDAKRAAKAAIPPGRGRPDFRQGRPYRIGPDPYRFEII